MKKPKNYWNLENCKNESLNYNSRSEWMKNNESSYRSAIKNNWIEHCCQHMVSKTKIQPNGFWNFKKCINSAKKYSYRSEWQKKESGAYDSALRNNWLDICCKHMITLGDYKKRKIYALEFEDNSVYIGLTHDIIERINRHLKDNRSIVFKKHKQEKINYIIKEISDYIEVSIAQKLEENTINKYKSDNWIILNSMKPGGIGGNIKIWTKEKCLEEALKYKHKSEWEKKSPNSYNAARKQNWINFCSKHMMQLRKPNGYWTLEICINSAKKFKSKTKWKNQDLPAYSASKRYKYLDEINKIWQ